MESHITNKCVRVHMFRQNDKSYFFKPMGGVRLPWVFCVRILLVVCIQLVHSNYILIHNTSV